jgi:hypothetical protein
VNGEQCDDESHEEVIRQIKVAPSPLKLLVVRDPRMRVHAKKVTQALLGEEHTYVMNDSTNIPRRNSCAPLHFFIDVLADPVPFFPLRLYCCRLHRRDDRSTARANEDATGEVCVRAYVWFVCTC